MASGLLHYDFIFLLAQLSSDTFCKCVKVIICYMSSYLVHRCLYSSLTDDVIISGEVLRISPADSDFSWNVLALDGHNVIAGKMISFS